MQNDWRDRSNRKQSSSTRRNPRRPTGGSSRSRWSAAMAPPSAMRCGASCLSSLPGFAITAVRIKSVLHEFSTIPGVKEDVTDIVLNLKEVRLRLHEGDQITATLKSKGEGAVTAERYQRGAEPRGATPESAHRHARQGRRPRHGNRHQTRPRRCYRGARRRRRADRHHPPRCGFFADSQSQLHRHQRARRPAHRLRSPRAGNFHRRLDLGARRADLRGSGGARSDVDFRGRRGRGRSAPAD